MEWGFNKELKNTRITKQDEAILLIRHFWRKVSKLFDDEMVDKMRAFFIDHPDQEDKFVGFFDRANEVCKKYFLGEANLEDVKKALEQLYQRNLQLYHFLRRQTRKNKAEK